MIRENAEVAILGAGFAGSLMAMILQRQGRKPVLIERGAHPRFAIGESSTPLANLSLEKLCCTYDLPRLLPLSKYGSWQQTYPKLICGLKRGFSFFKHRPHQQFKPQPDHANELLVAASPSNELSDTHWYREHFDHFLVREVQKLQIPYFDCTRITSIKHEQGWLFRGKREDVEIEVKARFLIDASGAASIVARALGIDCNPQELQTNSWVVYSHFYDVELWENVLADAGGNLSDHPYRCDDAALHHILDNGWMWVLRFNNGLTSAGIVLNGEQHNSLVAQKVWKDILERYPSIARQFARADAIRPFVRTGRLQRRAKQVVGDDWAMLPHTAYFIDPLLSAGNAHTLLGLERLARIIEEHWGNSSLASQLGVYNVKLQREIDFLDRLIHGCYCAFGHFELLTAYSMYYFAGAIYSETRRRKGTAITEDEFLFSHHEPFRTSVMRGYHALRELSKSRHIPRDSFFGFRQTIAEDIAPYNISGLCDPYKHNMYPFVHEGMS